MLRPIPQNSTVGEEGGQCVLLGRSINRILRLSVDLGRRQLVYCSFKNVVDTSFHCKLEDGGSSKISSLDQ